MWLRVRPLTDRTIQGSQSPGVVIFPIERGPLGVHPGDPHLHAFLKEMFYRWLMLVYRSVLLEFTQVL